MASALAVAGVVSLAGVHAAAATGSTAVIRAGDVSVVEGDSGNAVVKMPVDLSIAAATTVKVPYTLTAEPGTGADASDVVYKPGYVTFAPGVTTKAINVSVVGDTIVEPDQRFALHFGSPVGPAVVDPSNGELVVQDDDANGVNTQLEASVGGVRVEEADGGSHIAYIPITLNRPAPQTVRVRFQLDCAAAAMITDVSIKQSGQLTFAKGQRVKLIPFQVTPDVKPEDIRQFTEAIAASFGPLSILDGVGTTEVVDNDGVFPGFGRALPAFAAEPLPSSAFNGGTVGTREQISVASDGTPAQYPVYTGDGPLKSNHPAMSSNGRYVVFDSRAYNLVQGDTNGLSDVFVRDRQAGTTERVSVKPDGSQINAADVFPLEGFGASGIWEPAISGDGRYVAYTTAAPLLPADAGQALGAYQQDVYLYDRVSHGVELVSAMPDGSAAGGVFGPPSVSASGRYVAFAVSAGETALPAGGAIDPNAYRVFVRDRLMGTTSLAYDGNAQQPVISADGRSLAIVADGAICPVGPQVLVVDLQTGSTDRVDLTNDGQGAAEDTGKPSTGLGMAAMVFNPAISSDGRYVTFNSFAWNLIPGMDGPLARYSGAFPMELVHAYVRDRVAHTTTMVGSGSQYDVSYSDAPSITDDGRYVASGNLAGGLRLTDRTTATTSAYAVGASPATYDSHPLSPDGRYVAFSTDIWPNGDVFVERLH